MNLGKPVCVYLDEMTIMPWMDEKTAKKVLAMIDDCGNTIVPFGTNSFEFVPKDYYKYTMNQLFKNHD